MRIAVYISSHGFGHLAQIAPVLNRLHAVCPNSHLLIRCTLPESEIRSRITFAFELDSEPVDVGVVQKNAVQEDRQASIQLMRHWITQLDKHIERDIALLTRFKPGLILSNISPLAFPVAQALGVPSIALATLDWHSIYCHWLDANDPILNTLAKAYAACDLLLTPPMAMAMPVFSKQQAIGLIAPHAKNINLQVPLPPDQRRKALVLFGGCGNPPYNLSSLANMSDWLFLIPDAPDTRPDNVFPIHFDSELQPIDLMATIDVVLCKPGYGVLSECWRSNTPIAWLERPDFPEFPMLKTWLDGFPACGMSRSDFQQGHWQQALDTAKDHHHRFPALNSDGAIDAVNIIRQSLATKQTK